MNIKAEIRTFIETNRRLLHFLNREKDSSQDLLGDHIAQLKSSTYNYMLGPLLGVHLQLTNKEEYIETHDLEDIRNLLHSRILMSGILTIIWRRHTLNGP